MLSRCTDGLGEPDCPGGLDRYYTQDLVGLTRWGDVVAVRGACRESLAAPAELWQQDLTGPRSRNSPSGSPPPARHPRGDDHLRLQPAPEPPYDCTFQGGPAFDLVMHLPDDRAVRIHGDTGGCGVVSTSGRRSGWAPRTSWMLSSLPSRSSGPGRSLRGGTRRSTSTATPGGSPCSVGRPHSSGRRPTSPGSSPAGSRTPPSWEPGTRQPSLPRTSGSSPGTSGGGPP